jgi:hypothetical protein
VSFALTLLDNVPTYYGTTTAAVPPTVTVTSITKASPLSDATVSLNVSAIGSGFRIILNMNAKGAERIPYMTTIPNTTGDVDVTMPADKLLAGETLVVYASSDVNAGSSGTPLGLLLTITTPSVAGVAAQSIPSRTTSDYAPVETHGQLAATLPFTL